MKVSIVVPFHNEQRYVKDCLDSLAEQISQDFEVILVCDHTEKDLLEELRAQEVPFPMTILELTDRSGVAAARNEGIRAAKGEFILFLDIDDYLEKTAISLFLEHSEDQDLIYGRKQKTWYSRKVYYDNIQKQQKEGQVDEEEEEEEEIDRMMPEIREGDTEWLKIFGEMVQSNFMITGLSALGILYRREYILENQLFFEEDYKYYADLPFVVRAMCGTEKVFEVRKKIYVKRSHNDPINLPSLSQVTDDKVKHMEIVRAYLTMKACVKQQDERVEVFIDSRFIRYYVKKIAPFYIKASQEDAQELYKKTAECLPLITEASKKKAMRYSRRLIRCSMKNGTGRIAKMVKHHSSFQTLGRILTKRSMFKRYVYQKVFVKLKVKPNVVIMETFFGRNYSDNPKYIFEYMNKNYPGKYKYVWVLNKKQNLPYPAVRVKRFTLRYFYYMATAKYFVFNVRQPKYIVKRKDTVFLETWHGTPLKKLAYDMEDNVSASPLKDIYYQSRFWDYLIAPNRFSHDVFRSCFMYDGNMLDTGYPRNDILHLGEEDRAALTEEVKRELGIPKGKKVILYAPTWRDDEFYDHAQYKFTLQLDLDLLRKELGEEYVVLLRTHYFIVDSLDLTAYEGFAFNGSTYNDIARLYLISDILVTDYSSVFFDYANLKRPMLFYTYDLEKYRDVLHGFYIDMEEELPGPMLFTTEEVVDAIRKLPELEDKYKEKYDVFYEKYCGWEDGNASKKVVEAVFGK